MVTTDTDRRPTVSIIIATYNWSAALRCAIRSVLLQTHTDYELLVVGDACTDDSEAVATAFIDPRIKWHNLDHNSGGQWGPNNWGLSVARGEWIAYLGHDDLWYPTHLESCLRAARENAADLVAGVMILFGPTGTGIRYMSGVFANDHYTTSEFMPPSSIIHRRSLIERIGYWKDPESIALPVDCQFLKDAADSNARIVSTNELTIFKFNAAWRRDSYKIKSTTEQEEMLSRIESEKDFRSQELIEVMRAAAADKFQMLKNPNETSLAIGSVHRSNRKYKGADENFLAAQLRSLDRKEKFYLVESQPGFEWHGMERHPSFGVFRWSGPDNVSIVDLPIALDRELSIKIHILYSIDAHTLDNVALTVNARRVEVSIRPTKDGTFLLSALIQPDPTLPVEKSLRISFQVEKTKRPCDIGAGADRRWLGLAVNWIELAPASFGGPLKSLFQNLWRAFRNG